MKKNNNKEDGALCCFQWSIVRDKLLLFKNKNRGRRLGESNGNNMAVQKGLAA